MTNENSLIEFFTSFDTFWKSFFNIVSKFDSSNLQLEVTITPNKSRNFEALVHQSRSTMKTKTGIFGRLDFEIISNFLFYFLDLQDLCKSVVNVNKNWHAAYKDHLCSRIYLLSKETKQLEEDNIDIVQAIRHKRSKFYTDYEIEPPQQYINNEKVEEWDDYRKKRAIQLLNSFSISDVCGLKSIRNYNKVYEVFSAPLVILFQSKPERKATADGKLHVSYWKTAFKLISDPQFLTKIKEFKLESINQQTFEEIEKFIRDDRFKEEKAEQINKWLGWIIRWVKGVYMFHQYLREYSLSKFDYKILTNTERNFAMMMDKLWYRNFRMLRYVQECCQNKENIEK